MIFKYTQPKTNNDIRCNGDCMIRAVTIATGESYTKIHELMYKHGWRAARRNSKGKFEDQVTKTLDELGVKWLKSSFPAEKGKARMTAKEMSKIYPSNTFILRQAGHLSCLKNGVVMDTWNTSERCVYYAWELAI